MQRQQAIMLQVGGEKGLLRVCCMLFEVVDVYAGLRLGCEVRKNIHFTKYHIGSKKFFHL